MVGQEAAGPAIRPCAPARGLGGKITTGNTLNAFTPCLPATALCALRTSPTPILATAFRVSCFRQRHFTNGETEAPGMKPLAQGHMALERRLGRPRSHHRAWLGQRRKGREEGGGDAQGPRSTEGRGGRAGEGDRAGSAAGLTLALCTASCAPRSCSQMRAGSGSSAPSAPSTARLTPNRPSMRPRLRSSSAAFSAGAVNSSSTARAAMAGATSRGGAGGRRRRRPLSVLPLYPSSSGGVGPPGRLGPARVLPPGRTPSYTIPQRQPQLGNCG